MEHRNPPRRLRLAAAIAAVIAVVLGANPAGARPDRWVDIDLERAQLRNHPLDLFIGLDCPGAPGLASIADSSKPGLATVTFWDSDDAWLHSSYAFAETKAQVRAVEVQIRNLDPTGQTPAYDVAPPVDERRPGAPHGTVECHYQTFGSGAPYTEDSWWFIDGTVTLRFVGPVRPLE